MRMMLAGLARLHDMAFLGLQRALENWFLALAARLTFGGALAVYFWSEGLKNILSRQGGFFDYVTVEPNALAQLAPKAFEAAGHDASRLGVDYWLLAYLGTLAEFLLPALILLGLLTRLASLAMIGFIGFLTWVEVEGRGAAFDASLLFDRIPDHEIMDQRLLWLFPLLYLVIRGGGALSLDALLLRRR